MNVLRPDHFPLRLRLTLWYMLSLGVLLTLFAGLLYLQVKRSLLAQVDAALRLAAGQALINLSENDGQWSFQSAGSNPQALRQLQDDFVIYLVAPDGAILATLSNENELPRFPAQLAGFQTLFIEGDSWRFYSREVTAGRLQVAQELDPVQTTLASLQAQLWLGLPVAFLLAGLGGYFLATRALRPIDRITLTAQAISAHDLGRRIEYQGPADEVGRLAQTLDQMLDRLQAAFGRERRFTGDAAHELRTPLAALKGRIGVTLSQPRQPAEYRETLRDMEQQVDRLIRLSQNLLLMARLEGGQSRPQPETIQLADFLGAVVDQVRPLAEGKGIRLMEHIPAGLTLWGDMDLLIRLHLNLLDNAVKYTPAGGRVMVEAAQRGAWLEVAIRDTGPGIAAEHLPHLFERFYRVEGDRSRPGDNGQGGAGLGLAIAHEIARAHGGNLTVQSEAGRGTMFVVRLPLMRET